jgi:tetratricopeptide (TPR) repeat protein
MDRRLDRLSPGTRRVLSTAAVIGRVFDIDLAIAAGAGNEDEVLDALDEGLEHAVIEPTSEVSRNHFSFTHGMLVDAVRRAINPRRVARIHERVAQAMEDRAPDNVAEIAMHYDRAGIAEKSYVHSMAAGSAALAMYAHAEARRFFDMAERAAQSADERAEALRRLAEVAETEGRYALTEELCDRALAGLADRPMSSSILSLRRMRQRTRAMQGQPAGETIVACQALLASAREIEDRAEEAALLNMISQYQGRLGEWREAESIARDAVTAAEAADNPRLLAETLTRLGTSMFDRRMREAGEFYKRALGLFRAVGDKCGEARCLTNIGVIHQRGGEVASAEEAFEEARKAANEAHASDLAGIASLNLGVLHMRRGQLELAGARYEEAMTRFAECSNESARLGTLYNMANLARDAEDWSTASSLYEQVMTVASRIGQPDVELGARAGQALAALAVGTRSLAEEAQRWIQTNIEPRPDWWFQGRDLVDSLRIRLAAERGDDARAMRLLHEAVAIAGKHDPYASAYLVAECGPSLRRNGEALLQLIDQISHEIEGQGFAAIERRLAILRLTLVASPPSAAA